MRTTTCKHVWPMNDYSPDMECLRCGMTVAAAEKESEEIHAEVAKFTDTVKARRKQA